MSSSLADLQCADLETQMLRESLVLLYQRLSYIVKGTRAFGGFVEPGDLPDRYQLSANVYPPLQMSFTEAERRSLASYATLGIVELLALAKSPLERLLMAALWKNGDLPKIGHIATGLGHGLEASGHLQESSGAPVFKQFGRHLAARDRQPIADQHTVRAYRMLVLDRADDPAHLRPNCSANEVRSYVQWVQRIMSGRGSQERLYAFDQSMYAVGKATKSVLASTKSRRRPR